MFLRITSYSILHLHDTMHSRPSDSQFKLVNICVVRGTKVLKGNVTLPPTGSTIISSHVIAFETEDKNLENDCIFWTKDCHDITGRVGVSLPRLTDSFFVQG